MLQAFIIAFYAEMYGFPLTIYFLTRFFGLDVARTKGGHLWAQLFGTPVAHIVAMVLGYAIVFSGATLVADGWRRIHRARREEKLMTDGVYARMRHPQYAGLFLIVFGEGVVHWPTIVSVAAFPIIVLSYTLLARKEEGQCSRSSATNTASTSGASHFCSADCLAKFDADPKGMASRAPAEASRAEHGHH